MIARVRARFSKGVLELVEKLDLEEGKDVLVSIEEVPTGSPATDGLRASAGGWSGMHDSEELKRTIYAAREAGSRQESRW